MPVKLQSKIMTWLVLVMFRMLPQSFQDMPVMEKLGVFSWRAVKAAEFTSQAITALLLAPCSCNGPLTCGSALVRVRFAGSRMVVTPDAEAVPMA